MSLAKVWNDNKYDFVQDFKGEILKVPAGKYIEMDYFEAHSFVSFPYPMKKNGQGVDDPTHFKMLRVEGTAGLDHKTVAYKSMVDGSLHPTEEAMLAYNKQFIAQAIPTEDAARAKKQGK